MGKADLYATIGHAIVEAQANGGLDSELWEVRVEERWALDSVDR